MNIGERIKERRKELSISVDDLAARINKNRATIYRYEKGEIENLPLDILEPLAEALETTPEHLMGWSEVESRIRTDNEFAEYVAKYKPNLQLIEEWYVMLKDYLPLTDDENEKLMHYMMFLISQRKNERS